MKREFVFPEARNTNNCFWYAKIISHLLSKIYEFKKGVAFCFFNFFNSAFVFSLIFAWQYNTFKKNQITISNIEATMK